MNKNFYNFRNIIYKMKTEGLFDAIQVFSIKCKIKKL